VKRGMQEDERRELGSADLDRVMGGFSSLGEIAQTIVDTVRGAQGSSGGPPTGQASGRRQQDPVWF